MFLPYKQYKRKKFWEERNIEQKKTRTLTIDKAPRGGLITYFTMTSIMT